MTSRLLLDNPLFLLSLCIGGGSLLGSLKFKEFSMGSSSTLFLSMLIGFVFAKAGIQRTPLPPILFNLSLIGFIAAVGLRASGSARQALISRGIGLIFLALIVPFAGFLGILLINRLGIQGFASLGVFVGSLTSSPGLGAILELSKSADASLIALIGLGYSIAYIPGVVLVILYASLFRKQRQSPQALITLDKDTDPSARFSLWRFALVVASGIALGSIRIGSGERGGFSLGVTGGVLIFSLLYGALFPRFRFEANALNPFRDIALNTFLAIVGLDYGAVALQALARSGLAILAAGTVVASFSLLVGHLLGRYIFHLDDSFLVGGICGGMTSTPGLAAAMESFDSETPIVGYAAAYPFALMSMIIWGNVLFHLLG